jgi:hypothetical protein
VRRINNVFIMFEDRRRLGIHTTKESKIRSHSILREYICADAIRFSENIITVNPDKNRKAEHVKEMLIGQIKDLRQYTVTFPNGTARSIVTGRHTSDGKVISGKTDDLKQSLANLLDTAERYRNRRLPVNYERINNLYDTGVNYYNISTLKKFKDERKGEKHMDEDESFIAPKAVDALWNILVKNRRSLT